MPKIADLITDMKRTQREFAFKTCVKFANIILEKRAKQVVVTEYTKRHGKATRALTFKTTKAWQKRIR